MPGLNLVRIYMYYGNTFYFVSRWQQRKCACYRQTILLCKAKGSSVYFTSKQILPFRLSGQNCDPFYYILDPLHDIVCVSPPNVSSLIMVFGKLTRYIKHGIVYLTRK